MIVCYNKKKKYVTVKRPLTDNLPRVEVFLGTETFLLFFNEETSEYRTLILILI